MPHLTWLENGVEMSILNKRVEIADITVSAVVTQIGLPVWAHQVTLCSLMDEKQKFKQTSQ